MFHRIPAELWGKASRSNIDIVKRAQSRILRIITEALWYLRNENIHRDLQIKLVLEIISEKKVKYIWYLVGTSILSVY